MKEKIEARYFLRGDLLILYFPICENTKDQGERRLQMTAIMARKQASKVCNYLKIDMIIFE